MKRRWAVATLTASVAVLVFVLVAVLGSGGEEPRADLVGAESAPPVAAAAPDLPPVPVVPLPGSNATAALQTAPAGVDPAAAAGAEPVRMAIPALGVDAPVVAVGLEADGSMELPGASDVGWYEPTRVRPGDPAGSAVLAAHVDFQGRRGVFFDLRTITEGAEVVVVARDGSERRFVVESRFQVDKDELPVEELFRVDGAPTLTLVTCGGYFDRSSRHYEDNIVVRARPA